MKKTLISLIALTFAVVLGAAYAAKAKPDGHFVLTADTATFATNGFLYAKPGYNAEQDFVPVGLIARFPMILVVNPQVPAKNLQEFIAWAKSQDNPAYASPGAGSPHHLATELFSDVARLKLLHAPYKGAAPAIQDVIGGQVPLMFDTTVVAAPFIQSGRVRPLAVTSAKRVASLPDVPTMAEAGLAGYDVVSWQAMFAPAGTPAAIVQRLQTEVAAILKQPDVQERLAKLGVEPSGMAPQQLADFQAAEIAKWAKVVKAANVKID